MYIPGIPTGTQWNLELDIAAVTFSRQDYKAVEYQHHMVLYSPVAGVVRMQNAALSSQV